MDILISAEKSAELEAKLNTILQNQQMLFALLQDAGRLLSEYGNYAMAQQGVDITDEMTDPGPMSRHIGKRLKYLLEKYGEVCRQVDAAKIMSVSPRTIARMLERGELRRVGTNVDVRSINDYLEGLALKAASEAKPQGKPQEKPQQISHASSTRQAAHSTHPAHTTAQAKQPDIAVESPIRIQGEPSEFALASMGIRPVNPRKKAASGR